MTKNKKGTMLMQQAQQTNTLGLIRPLKQRAGVTNTVNTGTKQTVRIRKYKRGMMVWTKATDN